MRKSLGSKIAVDKLDMGIYMYVTITHLLEAELKEALQRGRAQESRQYVELTCIL